MRVTDTIPLILTSPTRGEGTFEIVSKSWHPYAGNAIQFGNVKVSVLHPSEADHLSALSRSDPNASSVVLKIECSEASILLGADVERLGWKAILDRGADLNADVFKFPHHGAWYDGTPSLQQILDQVNPSLVVISVGSTNSYGHPSVETLICCARTSRRSDSYAHRQQRGVMVTPMKLHTKLLDSYRMRV